MKILFIHQNYPGQYYHRSLIMAADPAHQVAAIGEAENLRQGLTPPGVARFGYELDKPAKFRTRFEEYLARAGKVRQIMLDLRTKGFVPDIIVGHPAWGELMAWREVFPDRPLLAYAEHWDSLDPAPPPDPAEDWRNGRFPPAVPGWDYRPPAPGALEFDPEFQAPASAREVFPEANAPLALTAAEGAWLSCPTRFQLAKLPPPLRARASRLFDGLNFNWARPNPKARFTLPPTDEAVAPFNDPLPEWFPRRERPLTFDREVELVTFFNRTLEPARGWHTFARALPLIMARRPRAQVLVLGRTEGGYGPRLAGGNWRDCFLEEIRGRADLRRLHLPGLVPQKRIYDILALSRAHVYLTYPLFVGYSLVEALGAGAPLAVGDTAPLREFCEPGRTALGFDFFSPEALAEAVVRLLEDRELAARLGRAGRREALAKWSLEVWQPRWEAVMGALVRGEEPEKCF